MSEGKKSSFQICPVILALFCFCTDAWSEAVKPNRTERDVINIFSDQYKNLYISKRNSEIRYNIIGLDRFQTNQVIARIATLASIVGVNISASQTPNLGIIISDDLFTNEVFDSAKASEFGIPKLIVNGLADNWINRKNCAVANSTWGKSEIGLSLIVVFKNQNEEDIFRCIDRSLIESFGLDAFAFSVCVEKCFEKPYPYNIKAAFNAIRKCEPRVTLNRDAFVAYKEFSDCFWEDYKREAK